MANKSPSLAELAREKFIIDISELQKAQWASHFLINIPSGPVRLSAPRFYTHSPSYSGSELIPTEVWIALLRPSHLAVSCLHSSSHALPPCDWQAALLSVSCRGFRGQDRTMDHVSNKYGVRGPTSTSPLCWQASILCLLCRDIVISHRGLSIQLALGAWMHGGLPLSDYFLSRDSLNGLMMAH